MVTGAGFRPLARIRTAQLGDDAGLVGAAALARDVVRVGVGPSTRDAERWVWGRSDAGRLQPGAVVVVLAAVAGGVVADPQNSSTMPTPIAISAMGMPTSGTEAEHARHDHHHEAEHHQDDRQDRHRSRSRQRRRVRRHVVRRRPTPGPVPSSVPCRASVAGAGRGQLLGVRAAVLRRVRLDRGRRCGSGSASSPNDEPKPSRSRSAMISANAASTSSGPSGPPCPSCRLSHPRPVHPARRTPCCARRSPARRCRGSPRGSCSPAPARSRPRAIGPRAAPPISGSTTWSPGRAQHQHRRR